MTLLPEEFLKLLLAVVAGGALGLEREMSNKAAGFRTIMLISIGSCLVTMLALRLNGVPNIVANIVTGIGFLGAGVIMRDPSSRVTGITTAATVWLAAGLGIGAGSGAYLLTLVATALILVVMRVLNRIEFGIDSLWDMRRYQIILPCGSDKVDQVDAELAHCGLHVATQHRKKREGKLVCTWDAYGPGSRHACFVDAMLEDAEIQNFDY